MKIFNLVKDIKIYISELKNSSGKSTTIGFVPTMGALHKGHVSLIEKAKKENDVAVCSIFVNPIQFDNKEDFKKYPRDINKDIKKIKDTGCDILFNPCADEMYSKSELFRLNEQKFDLGNLDKTMEGKYRTGHFDGVAIVVNKLFDIVKPDKAYFGEKDFQQLCIIKYFVKQNNIPVQIIGCPIIREKDGLALSSRNVRLTYEQRKIAPVIYKILKKAKEKSKYLSVEEVKIWARTEINKNNIMKLEYFEIVDIHSLKSISKWSDTKKSIACIAVYLEKIRLIDNIIL
jgi:pantoate--beta-alanine ligase